MVQEGSEIEEKWRGFVRDEEALKTLYRSRGDDDTVGEPEPEGLPSLVIESTGAFLSYSIAISLLAEVCSLLHRDAYSPLPRPMYDFVQEGGGYRATVNLPMSPYLRPDQRRIAGQAMKNKRGAKQSAAFEACVLVHRQGGLDDHLRPIREQKGGDSKDAAGEEVDTSPIAERIPFTYENPLGSLYDPAAPLWLHPLHFTYRDGTKFTLGLVVATLLDIDEAIPLWADPASDDPSLTLQLGQAVRLDWSTEERETNLGRLDSFTRMILQAGVQSRPLEGRVFQHVVPLVNGSSKMEICWQVVDLPLYDVNLSELSPGDLVVTPYRGIPRSRLHIFEAVREEVILSDVPMPIETPLGLQPVSRPLSKFKSYEHLFRARVSLDPSEIELPMLQMAAVPRPRSWLSPKRRNVPPSLTPPAMSDVGPEGPMRQLLPLSVTRRSNIPLDIWQLLQGIPSYMRAIEDRVRVKRALKALALPPIPSTLAAQALTLPGRGTEVCLHLPCRDAGCLLLIL
jgi:endoribonuclease Dicer